MYACGPTLPKAVLLPKSPAVNAARTIVRLDVEEINPSMVMVARYDVVLFVWRRICIIILFFDVSYEPHNTKLHNDEI